MTISAFLNNPNRRKQTLDVKVVSILKTFDWSRYTLDGKVSYVQSILRNQRTLYNWNEIKQSLRRVI